MIDIKFISKTYLTDKDKKLKDLLGNVRIKDYSFTDAGVYVVISDSNQDYIQKSSDNNKSNLATPKQIKYTKSLLKDNDDPELNYSEEQLEVMTKVEIGKLIKKLQSKKSVHNKIINEPATEPQKEFIINLIHEGRADKSIDVNSLNKKEAGDIIKAISRG